MSDDLRRFRQGDPELFRDLIKRHTPLVMAVVESFGSDGDDLEDLVQEAWVKVYEQRKRYSGRGSLLSWILVVARNAALSRHRGRRSRERAQDRYHERDPKEQPFPDPIHDIALEAHARVLYRALMELPERQRMAIVLRVLEDRSPVETAELMGCEQATVRSLIRRGIHRIRREWGVG